MDLETLEDIEDTDNAFEKIELNELKAQIQYAINTLPDYQKAVSYTHLTLPTNREE